MGPGTHLQKRLKRGDSGINRLDKIAKTHDIYYAKAKNLQDKWKAGDTMIRAISNLPGKKKKKTKRVVKKIMQMKLKLLKILTWFNNLDIVFFYNQLQ